MIVKCNCWKLFQQVSFAYSIIFCENITLHNIRTDGIELVVACTESVLTNPPPVGSVITVKHSGFYKNGTMRHPFYWRVRTNILWNHISQETRSLVSYKFFFKCYH
jgi:hypothetical protein